MINNTKFQNYNQIKLNLYDNIRTIQKTYLTNVRYLNYSDSSNANWRVIFSQTF